ncbi:MAG TPA: formyl-CoA transferase [Xanthobacteraceae bacterium]|jgi:formyl-CoA transferase|nr:formyl-CoA transferase [Xanthobacteraceae bacterium]
MARPKVAVAKPKKIAKRIVKKSVVRAVTNRPAQMKADPKVTGPHDEGWPELPPPSTKPWGEAGKALEGVRILDFTHVQSGPTCTQLLGYMGADCIKVERPGVGDITRGQLRDVKGADSLYFTMLNGNKRSITIDSKHPKGKEILERLIQHCDVLVENFAPGALDRMGLTWDYIHKTNPRMIVASVKGFGPGPYEDCKVYENVAQCAGGAASTTGFREGPPLVTGAQIGDSGTGLHLAFGIVSALYQRMRTGRGQRVRCAMQDGVLNLARVKLRDQQRLTHGPLTEYSQHGEGVPFGKAVPRAGNDSGGGQPGWILKCKGWETDPDAYTYFITQAPVWGSICDLIGKPEWKTDPDYATPPARLPRLRHIFNTIEEWTKTKTKFEVMDICNQHDIPVGPILSMKEIAEDQSLRDTATVVEVDHPTRGKYLTVGNPIKMSDSITEVKRSPLLGEHTEQILIEELGYSAEEFAAIKNSGAITPSGKKETEAA